MAVHGCQRLPHEPAATSLLAACPCVQCMDNCGSCTSADSCDECQSGAFFDPATRACVQVPPLPPAHLLPEPASWLQRPPCSLPISLSIRAPCHLQCAPNCSECTSLQQCSMCEPGHTNVTTDGSVCSPCTESMCSSCPKGVDQCSSCQESGFGPDSTGRCVACTVERCSDCGESSTTCTNCSPGYLLDGASGSCAPCKVQNCSACRLDGGQEVCDICGDGYESPEVNPPFTECFPASS